MFFAFVRLDTLVRLESLCCLPARRTVLGESFQEEFMFLIGPSSNIFGSGGEIGGRGTGFDGGCHGGRRGGRNFRRESLSGDDDARTCDHTR